MDHEGSQIHFQVFSKRDKAASASSVINESKFEKAYLVKPA